jgi:hypothetical protein
VNDADLHDLFDRARKAYLAMSAEERREHDRAQAISFVVGNLALDGIVVTEDLVARAIDRVRLPRWILHPKAIPVPTLDETWTTDGFGAWAVEPPEGTPVVDGRKEPDPIGKVVLRSPMFPITRPEQREHVNGFLFLGETISVGAHRLAYAERLFPGITWKCTEPASVEDGSWLVGFVGDRARCALIVAKQTKEAASFGPRGGYPPCWDCDGEGGDYCEECRRGHRCEGCGGAGQRKEGDIW